jgi:ABC-type transport system substrate-binding protein
LTLRYADVQEVQGLNPLLRLQAVGTDLDMFTTNAILNPKNNVVARAGWDDIASVEAVGDHMVRFHLKKIYAPAITTFFCESGLAVTQEELASQSATIFLYFARQVYVTSPALRGFKPAPATSSSWNTWEWSI